MQESYVRISNDAEWAEFDIEDSSLESIEALFFKGW